MPAEKVDLEWLARFVRRRRRQILDCRRRILVPEVDGSTEEGDLYRLDKGVERAFLDDFRDQCLGLLLVAGDRQNFRRTQLYVPGLRQLERRVGSFHASLRVADAGFAKTRAIPLRGSDRSQIHWLEAFD